MKILFQYLKPYKWLVILTLVLAGINIGFSLVDPIIFGKLVDLGNYHRSSTAMTWSEFCYINGWREMSKPGKPGEFENLRLYGVAWLLLASITVAMISRIAKAFFIIAK